MGALSYRPDRGCGNAQLYLPNTSGIIVTMTETSSDPGSPTDAKTMQHEIAEEALAGGTVERPVFDAVLHPHRSLSGPGFLIVMGLAAVVSVTIGGFFLIMGAWPVFGFYGLELLALYVGLRVNYRRGLIYERLKLTRRALTVERGDVAGPKGRWQFEPYWLRVSIDDPVRHDSQIVLSSHGRNLVVGAFLSPGERLEFAQALRSALTRLLSVRPVADAAR